MKKFLGFLMQGVVCLLITNIALAQAPQAKTSAVVSTESSSSRGSDSPVPASLSISLVAGKITEAKRMLQSQPASSGAVTLAAFDQKASQIHLLAIAKDQFLTLGATLMLNSQHGQEFRLRVLNPNGVNTAVAIYDSATGRSLLPLVVKYPIVKGGAFVENAYYTSAHPVLRSPDVISAGRVYVTTMLDQAAAQLAQNGVFVAPELINIARHLVIVEHTDHRRFKNQDPAIYSEVLSLYALNRGDTYRYSVSSAGAGGMIQMIPKTYAAIREQHPNVILEPDFVTGMRDHANALKAMLLYIDDTWTLLEGSDEVQQALRTGIATKTELLAAGYNSNPYRLPGYLSTGGSAWRTLIPAETQMYLAIYQSVDSNLDFHATMTETPVDVDTSSGAPVGAALIREGGRALMSWVSKQVLRVAPSR